MAKVSGPFIVIYGDEDFLQDRFIESRVAAWKDRRQVHRRDAAHTKAADVLSLCENQSYFDEDLGRAVILDNAESLKVDKAFEQYVQEKSAQDQSSVILAVIRDNDIPKFWSEASTKGSQFGFFKFPPWKTKDILERFTNEATRLGLTLDEGVADMIYNNVGDNLRLVANEMQKMSYLVGDRKNITRADYLKILVPGTDVEPKQISEAALSRNLLATANRLSKIFKLMGEEKAGPAVTTSCLYLVERVLVARQMLDRGDSIKAIADHLKVHPYACEKNLIPLARIHSVKSLLGHMQNLCKLDSQVKGAARSKRTLVELAVLSIATRS